MKGKAHIYLDTSAYLCILLGEEGNAKLLKKIAKKQLCSSSLLVLEAERNLIRMSRENMLNSSAYFAGKKALLVDIEKMLLKDFSLDLCLLNTFPAIKTPRTLDLAHLRTALWFREQRGCNEFLTLDRHQAECAQELGFNVLS